VEVVVEVEWVSSREGEWSEIILRSMANLKIK